MAVLKFVELTGKLAEFNKLSATVFPVAEIVAEFEVKAFISKLGKFGVEVKFKVEDVGWDALLAPAKLGVLLEFKVDVKVEPAASPLIFGEVLLDTPELLYRLEMLVAELVVEPPEVLPEVELPVEVRPLR